MPGKDHRTRVTKMLIRRAFTDLLRVKPVQSISIKELCEKAGVNRGTFYAHYASVHDLLMQMEDEMLAEINEVLSSLLPADGGEVSSLRISTELFQCLKDNADLCTVTLGDFVSEGCIGLLRRWLREGMTTSAEDIAALAEKLMLQGASALAKAKT